MKPIDKDALVAEIERLQEAKKATAIDDRISNEQAEAYKVCVKKRNFVEDTLEEKEFDWSEEEKLRHLETIRQQTAIAAMQGLISAPPIEGVNSVEEITDLAVKVADALV